MRQHGGNCYGPANPAMRVGAGDGVATVVGIDREAAARRGGRVFASGGEGYQFRLPFLGGISRQFLIVFFVYKTIARVKDGAVGLLLNYEVHRFPNQGGGGGLHGGEVPS